MEHIHFEKANRLGRETLFEYVADFSGANEMKYAHLARIEDIESFVESLELAELGQAVKPGYVRQETFFALGAEGRILGRIDYRDQLNENLTIEGGNIGFEVRPSERNKGVGSTMLRLFLRDKVRDKDRVLMTCFEENSVSEKLIRRVGGVYEDTRPSPRNGRMTKRFWIDLTGS